MEPSITHRLGSWIQYLPPVLKMSTAAKERARILRRFEELQKIKQELKECGFGSELLDDADVQSLGSDDSERSEESSGDLSDLVDDSENAPSSAAAAAASVAASGKARTTRPAPAARMPPPVRRVAPRGPTFNVHRPIHRPQHNKQRPNPDCQGIFGWRLLPRCHSKQLVQRKPRIRPCV